MPVDKNNRVWIHKQGEFESWVSLIVEGLKGTKKLENDIRKGLERFIPIC